MSELITIQGIRELMAARLRGERLSDNWPDLLSAYIALRERNLKNMGPLETFVRPFKKGGGNIKKNGLTHAPGWEQRLIEEAKATRRALYAW